MTRHPSSTRTRMRPFGGNPARRNQCPRRDRGGRTTKYVYDEADRLTTTIFPDDTPGTEADNPFTLNVYEDGVLVSTSDERGKTTTYGYDDAGRQTTVTNALNQTTTTVYDASGRRTKVIDALNRETQFVYDAAGRLIETIYPDTTTGSQGDNPRVLVEYDGAGRKVADTDPMGRTTRYAYDKAGRLIAVFLPNPTTGANPALNLTGTLPMSTDTGVLVTRYSYDQLGNKLTQTDALNRVTHWRYDNAGRVLKRTLPLGQYETFVYDAFGRQQSHTDFRNRTTGYTYHPNTDRLATIDYPNDTDTSLTYTDDGQIDTVTDVNGTTSYDYDERHRLESVSWPNGLSIGYGYDEAGNRTSLTTANQSVAYTFDDLNRLHTVTPTLGGGGTYAYDAVGNRQSLIHVNGITTSYVYNPRNQLTELATAKGGTVEQKLAYTLDKNGQRLSIHETYHGGLTASQASYTYDAVKRLKTEYVSNAGGSRNVSWVYDKVGNRLSEARTGSVNKTTTYTYDDNDRLTNEIVTGTGAGTTTYTYDPADNLTQKDAPGGIEQYVYDDANRLRELIAANQEVTRYAYNHAGIRIGQTANATGSTPVTTYYLIDPNQAYAQVLEEHAQVGSAAKTLAALYVLGDDRISQHRPAAGATPASTRHYHADGLGSTRLLTTTTGAITDRYHYQAFGELDTPASTMTSDNRFLFTGEQLDPNTGFYYLRARYMNPGNGRFTQPDTFAGFGSDPPSLHKYLYTPSNPVNYTDPSGNSYIGAVSFAANLTLTAMSVVNTTIIAHDFLTGERELSAKEVGLAIVWAYVGSKAGPVFGKLERALQKAGCLSNSFTPDTLVETKDGLRRIDEVKVGDLVLSRNMETGENELQPVTAVMTSTKLAEIVAITLHSGATIEATPEHLMFVNGEWKQAQEVVAGALLSNADSRAVKVKAVGRTTKEIAVYDLTVAQNRNFYVSKGRVLVHNISPCEKVAQALAKAVPKSCLANFQCKEFAREFEKLLVKKDMKATRLCLRSRTGKIWSDVSGIISTNGIHVATVVGELVFDNHNPDGIPRAEWSKDLGVGEFDDLDLKEESIGGPGCIDD